MTSIALPVLGLAGDQNPSAAPKGALSEADNVVCDLPGQARPRPNHEVVYSNGAAAARCDAVLSFNGEWLAHDAVDGWRNDVGVLTGTASGPVDYNKSEPQSAQARGSMYIATADGVQRVWSPTATTIVRAGMDFAVSPAWPSTPKVSGAGPFTAPFSVGYRFVVKRRDENGYVKRGPPTGAFVLRDPSLASASGVKVIGSFSDERLYIETGKLLADDVVEVYRTKTVASSTAAIPPDYYLVKAHVVTTAEAAASEVSTVVVDDVADEDLGEALYTNPAQGGALSAKFDPPIMSRCLAAWNRCLWVGSLRERAALKLTITNTGEDSDSASPAPNVNELRLGIRDLTSGTISIGSNQITGVGWATGVVPGMYITDDDGNGPLNSPALGVIPTGTKITAITGTGPYTITMSANATGNLTINSGANRVQCSDAVRINGVDFVVHNFTVSPSLPRQFRASGTEAETAVFLANAINLQMAKVGDVRVRAFAQADTGAAVGSGAVGQVLLINIDGDDWNWGSTRPSAFTPTISTTYETAAGLQDVYFTERYNRVMWSAPDEPEAWPILNYVDLGDDRTDIQRIVPLRDAMLVFTTTGLYRVTGTPPGNWSVDLLDASLRLVRAECVDVLDGTAYAFTNRGVVTVNEQGVTRIVSDGKVEEDLAPAMALCIDDPTQRGARVMCWEREGLVLVALPTVPVTETSPCSSEVLCYAPKTGSWTRWPEQYWYAGASNGISGYPYVAATRPDQLPLYEIRQFVEPRGYDNDWPAIAVTSGAGTTSLVISDAARGSWYPRSGDWLLVGTAPNVWRRVTGVVDGGATWTLTLDTASPSPLATFTAYEGAPVLLEWLPSAMGANEPFMVGTWREAVFSFYGGPADSGEVKDANARIVFGVRHDGTDTPVELVGTPARSIVQLRPYRFGWPRNASRRGVCFPRLSFSEIDWLPRISGVLLVGDAVSERVRR